MKIREIIKAAKSKDEFYNSMFYLIPFLIIVFVIQTNPYLYDLILYSFTHFWPAVVVFPLIVLAYFLMSYLFFLIFGLILYFGFKHPMVGKVIKIIIIMILLSPFIVLGIYYFFSFFDLLSFSAKKDIPQFALRFIVVSTILILIGVYRKQIWSGIKWAHKSINDFLFSEGILKPIPLGLGALTFSYFIMLLNAEYKKMLFGSNYNDHLTTLALCLVFIPLVVFIVSGVTLNRLYNRFKSYIFLLVLQIINLIIFGSVFSIVWSFLVNFFKREAYLSSTGIFLLISFLGFLIFLGRFIYKNIMSLIAFAKDGKNEEY